jgi:hypothetical protein
MKDDFLTREWAENHRVMSDGIDKLVRKTGAAILDVFEELHDVQFDAPWRRQPKPPACLTGPR